MSSFNTASFSGGINVALEVETKYFKNKNNVILRFTLNLVISTYI